MMGDVAPEFASSRPLVGRVQELDQLASLIGMDREPLARAVVLAGDAGVGKTRTLVELRDRARAAGWRVVVGHCLDIGDGAMPYLPFSEILGGLAAETTGAGRKVLAGNPATRGLQPGRRLLSGTELTAAGQDGEAHSVDVEHVDRGDLFEAVHDVFEQLAEESPLLVLVEDVHWADRSTRELLSFLFTRAFERQVAIIASYRSDDLHRKHPLRATVAEWARVPGVTRLQLAPLGDPDVRRLVRSLHSGPLRESDLGAIVERAEGNAFFVEELVVATELDGAGLPDDLADLLLVRLDRLDDDARQAVRAASVAGRRVSHELLSRVAGLASGALDQALRLAVESNVLVPVDAAGYSFRHALLAEAVYDDLLPGERVRLHAAYAGALRNRESEGTAAELARHARAAHDISTAVAASIRAGDEAMSIGGPDEAARHYELALELVSDQRHQAGDGVDVVRLTAKASDAVSSAGNPYRALALVQDQLDQLPRDASDEERARLLLALGTAALLGDTEVYALEATTQALSLVGPEPSALRAKVLSVHARANADRQRDDEATRFAAEALELGRSLQLSRVVADATTTLARLDERADDPESSRETFEKIVAEARAEGHLTEELRGLHSLGALYFEAGDLTGAADSYAIASTRAVESGRPWAPYGFDARVMAGITSFVQGRWEHVAQIVDVTGQRPPALAEAALAALAMTLHAGRGDRSGIELLAHVRPWWERDGFVAILSGTAAIDLYGDSGRLDQAIETHDDVVRTVSAIWENEHFMARVRLSALLLGQLASGVSATAAVQWPALEAKASQLLGAALEAHRRGETRKKAVGPEGLAWTARARAEHLRLCWLTGIEAPTEEELVTGWEQAVEAFEVFGHRFETARSRARLATALRAVGLHARARESADLARATAEHLGAAPLLTELRALGSARPVRSTEASRAGESLTAREQEILELVAQGRTNGEIARRLFISAKTVSVHVSNILAKLGASGRTEAASLARKQGLLVDS